MLGRCALDIILNIAFGVTTEIQSSLAGDNEQVAFMMREWPCYSAGERESDGWVHLNLQR